MKKWLLFLLKLALTAACLWWAFSRVDLRHSVFARPGDLHWSWIAAGIGFGGGTIGLSALRWWLLLRAQGIAVSLWRAIELTLVGNLFNLFAVGGVGGDAARIFLLIRRHPDRKLAVTMSVMVDHLVGLVAMAVVFFAMTAGRFEALEDQSALGRGAIKFAWFFFGGGLAFVALLFVMASPWVHGRIHRPGREWKWDLLQRVPEIYDVYRRKWGHALLAFAASVMMLPVYYATFWCGARALGSGVAPGEVFTAMPVVDAISALPLSVSGIGVREKTFEILMHDLTGMSPEAAISASLIGFSCSLVWAFSGALLFLRPADRVSMKTLEENTSHD